MNFCCELDRDYKLGKRVLLETDNFFVMPSLGPINIEGYLLLCSKKHYHGTGEIPFKLHSELQDTLEHTKDKLRKEYGDPIFTFEHGPRICNFHGGSCLDHAHLHIIPTIDIIEEYGADIIRRLNKTDQFYRVDRINNLERIFNIYKKGKTSYLFIQTPDNINFVTEVNFLIPHQYMRRLVAQKIGSKEWNWKKYPQHEIVDKTLQKLSGRF